MKAKLSARLWKFVTEKPNVGRVFNRVPQVVMSVVTALCLLTFLMASHFLDPTAGDPFSGAWGRFWALIYSDLPRPDAALPALAIFSAGLLFICSFCTLAFFEDDDSDRPTAGPAESGEGHVLTGTSGDGI